jgi:hypothetical protein
VFWGENNSVLRLIREFSKYLAYKIILKFYNKTTYESAFGDTIIMKTGQEFFFFVKL